MADPKIYNEEETAVLRQARHLRDMVESEGWKVYLQILDVQIATRESLIMLPMSVLSQASEEFKGMDYQSKQAQLESIKGALIALRLCKAIPQTTIEQARDIARDHGDRSDQETP
jgi:hypothetical protein